VELNSFSELTRYYEFIPVSNEAEGLGKVSTEHQFKLIPHPV